MSLNRQKERFVRILPGRLRIEVAGLQGNESTADLLLRSISSYRGMKKVEPCTLTGRMLVLYDEGQASLHDIFRLIRIVEEQASAQAASTGTKDETIHEAEEAKQEAAAASEVESAVPDNIRLLPQARTPGRKKPAEKIPPSLVLSMGGLAVLGIKQLLMGPSNLARSPVPFYMSALVSVVTGYPFIKRGIEAYSEKRKINSDLVLGTSALALALVRENLVVLAGLSILQYVNWKRSRLVMNGRQVPLSPEIESYSEKAGKWGMIAAGATWAFTRNPLRAIAVLLAANPRPMTGPAQYAWNQAELVSGERHYPVPAQGSLSQLARTKTLLIEDASDLFQHPEIEELNVLANKEEDADKLICSAASLMEKSSHPWKDEVRSKAKQTCRTLRTAFHVKEDKEGLQGKVSDHLILLGSAKYMEEHGIDASPYLLKAKRLMKNGCGVLFAAKQGPYGGEFLGLIVKHQEPVLNEKGRHAAAFLENGWRVGVLRNSLEAGDSLLKRHRFDESWLLMEPGEVIERIARMRQSGEEVLFVLGQEPNMVNEYLSEAGVPTVSINELNHVQESMLFAETIDRTVNEHALITKRWNIVGTALATMGMITAPVANLASDALSLVFMSRTKRVSEAFPAANPHSHQTEIATAAEAPLWHTMGTGQITGQFQVNEQHGLTSAQVASMRKRYGKNKLAGKKPTPWIVSFFAQCKEFTTVILLGTSVLALFTGGMFDGFALASILLANAAIGTIQERKAEKVVETLNQFQPPMSKAIRNGQEMEISAVDLVPGDIVCFDAGDRVPADIRLIRTWNLRVNEAALTGESLPVDKDEADLTEDCPLSERKNMLYMGTDICGGKGIGIVVHTGMNTEMGHLMSLMKKQDKEVTPLQERVTSISKKFVKAALLAGGTVFLIGMLRGIPIMQMISTSIALVASAIPEGLPVTITIALSAGIYRMASKKALVRKLSSLETLGRTTVICTDKTGTLTKNEMTVKAISTVDRAWTVTGDGYDPDGGITEMTPEVAATTAAAVEPKMDNGGTIGVNPDLKRLIQICMLCNNSKLEKEEGYWITRGDPTEGALLTLAAKTGVWEKDMAHWHRGLEIPFDSDSAKMSVVCKDTQTEQKCYLFTKGAVETILRYCSRYQQNGEIYPLSEEQKERILQQNIRFSADALRVLAFAYRPVDGFDAEEGMDEKDLIYVGMVGMIDPPKADVQQSIREALALGVKPVMITGDHPITAIAIAKQLGIYNDSQKVLSGHELERLSDDELVEIVDQVSIFARVAPEHKLRIVTAYQKRGHIVSMTGDGINDTPAIKQANVGIAMGRTGTEVTKETADMVLTEDHFGAIVDGIKEGRTIMGNIRKAIGCLLTGNLAEIIVTSVAVAAGLPIPLAPIQILLMHTLTDATPATIFAINPGNKTKKTIRTDIVDKELYQKVVIRGLLLGMGVLGLFAWNLAAGAPLPVAKSVVFATLVSGQLIQTFSWRQEGSEETIRDWTKDRFLVGALGLSSLAALAVLYVPTLAGFFNTAPLSLGQWIPILGVAGSVSMLSKLILSLISRKQEDETVRPAGGFAPVAV